jgi:hypothetical protein
MTKENISKDCQKKEFRCLQGEKKRICQTSCILEYKTRRIKNTKLEVKVVLQSSDSVQLVVKALLRADKVSIWKG